MKYSHNNNCLHRRHNSYNNNYSHNKFKVLYPQKLKSYQTPYSNNKEINLKLIYQIKINKKIFKLNIQIKQKAILMNYLDSKCQHLIMTLLNNCKTQINDFFLKKCFLIFFNFFLFLYILFYFSLSFSCIYYSLNVKEY